MAATAAARDFRFWGGGNGDIFEFVGNEFQPIGEFFERGLVVKIGGNALRDAAYRRLRRRIKKTEPETERIASQCQHITQLTPAEDPDGHEDFLDLFRRGREPSFSNCNDDGSGAWR